MNNDHANFMFLAIEQAKLAKEKGGWPFGAVIVKEGVVVGKGYGSDKSGGDVTDHAELQALREACKALHTNDLSNCVIYCTNEPCVMCAAGICQANIRVIIIGASRDDIPWLLRPRKLRVEDIVGDSGLDVKIIKGVLRDEVISLFQDVKENG